METNEKLLENWFKRRLDSIGKPERAKVPRLNENISVSDTNAGSSMYSLLQCNTAAQTTLPSQSLAQIHLPSNISQQTQPCPRKEPYQVCFKLTGQDIMKHPGEVAMVAKEFPSADRSKTAVRRKLRRQGSRRKSEAHLTAEFKAEVVKYCLEVVPNGKGRGGTRGINEAAKKYAVSFRSVHVWVQNHLWEGERIDKSAITDEFKEEVVRYCLEEVPGGRGKDGTRGTRAAGFKYGVPPKTVWTWTKKRCIKSTGSCPISNQFKEEVLRYVSEVAAKDAEEDTPSAISDAAHKYGISEHRVRKWIKDKQSGFVRISKSEITKDLKEKVVNFALEVVPDGQGKGGRRGMTEAARKYGLSASTVKKWVDKKECGFASVNKNRISPAFKEEVLSYAMEEIPEGQENAGTRGAKAGAQKYRIPESTVLRWLNTHSCTSVRASQNEVSEELKAEAVRYALEVVPGGVGKDHSRGCAEAAIKYGVSSSRVYKWIRKEQSVREFLSKDKRTDELKAEVVRYALEVVPEGKGKGGSRGAREAALKYGISTSSVSTWMRREQSGWECLSKNNLTNEFKQEVVHYASEIVPGGLGKGGSRGIEKAALKYGVTSSAVSDWMRRQQSGFQQLNKDELTDQLKDEAVLYALEVIPGGLGKGGCRGATEAALKYGISRQSVRKWMKMQKSQIKSTHKIGTVSSGIEALSKEIVEGKFGGT